MTFQLRETGIMSELMGVLLLFLGSFPGTDCSFFCPSNCMLPVENGTGTCTYTTGECLHGCQPGYAGQNCSVECPQACSSSNINGVEICNATSRECFFGCEDGFYGPRCENQCSSFDNICKRCSVTTTNSVVCNECGYLNFYIENGKCVACNYWCGVNVTSPLPTCKKEDGYCYFGCKTGRYGFKCGRSCSNLCKRACHRDTGTCLTGCKSPIYCGPTCELTCNDGCTSQRCNQSCSCSVGCNPKKWGEKCDKLCIANCNTPPDPGSNICDRSNGSCLYGCDNDKYWGSQCEKSCSSDCIGEVCEQASGYCTGGCNSTMVYGLRCDMKCEEDCVNGTCSTNLNSLLIGGFFSGSFLFFVAFAVLIAIAFRRYRICKVCIDTKIVKDEQGEYENSAHDYATLQHEPDLGSQATHYETLNQNEDNTSSQKTTLPYANVEMSQLP